MSASSDTVELIRLSRHSDRDQSPQGTTDDAAEDEVISLSETPQDENDSSVYLSRKTKLSRKLKKLIIGQEDDSKDKVELKKELTVLSGVAFITGNLIGSGIFITPKKILSNTGSFGLTLVVWIIGAIIALVGSLCYIELGLVVRKSGGEYPLILTAYSFKKRNKWVELLGKILAFLFSWTSVFIIRSLGASIILLTCARYLSRPFYIDCEAPRAVVTVLALSVLSESLYTCAPPPAYTPYCYDPAPPECGVPGRPYPPLPLLPPSPQYILHQSRPDDPCTRCHGTTCHLQSAT